MTSTQLNGTGQLTFGCQQLLLFIVKDLNGDEETHMRNWTATEAYTVK